MKIQFKIWLDTYIGAPVLKILGIICRLFVRTQNATDQVPQTILITKYQGMGSLVIAAPAIKRLKERFPEAKLIFLGTEATAPLARLMPEFDMIISLRDRSVIDFSFSFLSALFQLRRFKIDFSFDLEVYSSLAAILSTFLAATKRFGFILNSVSDRQYVYTDLVYFNRNSYLGRAYWTLFEAAFPNEFQNADLHDYRNWRGLSDGNEVSISGRYIVLNIHTSDLSIERKWPREYFENWALKLLNLEKNVEIVLLGHGMGEELDSAAFVKHERILNMAGKLSLIQVLSLISKAELVVSNDSAPLHFANALGVKLVGIFGPTRAESYFDLARPNTQVLKKEIYCSPCVHHWERTPCLGDNQCMKQMSWIQLWNMTAAHFNLEKEFDSNADKKKSAYLPGRFYKS